MVLWMIFFCEREAAAALLLPDDHHDHLMRAIWRQWRFVFARAHSFVQVCVPRTARSRAPWAGVAISEEAESDSLIPSVPADAAVPVISIQRKVFGLDVASLEYLRPELALP